MTNTSTSHAIAFECPNEPVPRSSLGCLKTEGCRLAVAPQWIFTTASWLVAIHVAASSSRQKRKACLALVGPNRFTRGQKCRRKWAFFEKDALGCVSGPFGRLSRENFFIQLSSSIVYRYFQSTQGLMRVFAAGCEPSKLSPGSKGAPPPAGSRGGVHGCSTHS